MIAEVEDLKLSMDDAVQTLGDTVPEIEKWEPWLVYFFEDLELMASSFDPNHPDKFLALLERLMEDIDTKLKKGGWKNGIDLASMIKREE